MDCSHVQESVSYLTSLRGNGFLSPVLCSFIRLYDAEIEINWYFCVCVCAWAKRACDHMLEKYCHFIRNRFDQRRRAFAGYLLVCHTDLSCPNIPAFLYILHRPRQHVHPPSPWTHLTYVSLAFLSFSCVWNKYIQYCLSFCLLFSLCIFLLATFENPP